MAGAAFWQYESDKENVWKDMPSEYSTLHEDAYQDGQRFFNYTVYYKRGTRYYYYWIDLENFIQTNCSRQKKRRLRRLQVTHEAQFNQEMHEEAQWNEEMHEAPGPQATLAITG